MAGIDVVAGLDLNKKYSSTFSANFPDSALISEDVQSLSPQELARRARVQPGELCLLAGGPPCQGFSKNVPRKERRLADPRNLLMRRFLDYCEYLLPESILIENVAEMRNGFDSAYTSEICDRLDAAGYSVVHEVFNAADFGVPQRRRRAFFLATRGATAPSIPVRTHFPPRDDGVQALFATPSHVTVWEAISDLPSLTHGESIERWEYASSPESAYQELIRSDTGFVTNHQSRALRPKQLSRLAALEPGQGNKDLPRHLRVRGGYSGAYGRLTQDMVCPTITRWVFHPGSGRWGHPVDTRLISIREIARIQGFPDSFRFCGSYTDMAGQLGNAVPPLLAKAIASSLTRKNPSGARASRLLSQSRR